MLRTQRSLLTSCVIMFAAAAARAQCFEWSNAFSSNGTSNDILCQAAFDDGSGLKLYVGGTFTTAGDRPTGIIARWNGVGWENVGGGIAGDVSSVNVMRVLDLGDGPKLYVGGRFDFAGGQAANNIAVWDGASWSALGAGLTGLLMPVNGEIVYALTAFDDGSGLALYAGGSFDTSGAATMRGVARWNGTQWSAVPNGDVLGAVRALEVYDSGTGATLYASGNFHEVGDTFTMLLARYDGAGWVPIIGPMSTVYALQVYDDGTGPQLYAAGNFNTLNGGVTFASLARWDGTTLERFPTTPYAYQSLSVLDDGAHGEQLYACGPAPSAPGLAVVRWDGATWSAVGASTSPNGAVWSLASYDDGGGAGLFAGGAFNAVGGQTANFVARFDGAAWVPLGAAHAPDATVVGLGTFDFGAGDELVAAGWFRRAGDANAAGIARWNAVTWSDIGGAVVPSMYVVGAWDDGGGADLFLGGEIGVIGSTQFGECIASWDGNTWSQLGSGIPIAGQSRYVRALAAFDDGSGEALFVGGRFRVFDGAPGNRVAKWNGSTWSSLGAGVSEEVRALCVFDDGNGPQLYVGGEFDPSGGLTGRLRRWNGTSWSALAGGSPDGGAVNALAVFDDGRGPALYAGGQFDECGGATIHNLARWDGDGWEAVGGGTEARVNALAVFDDGRGPALYAAGQFVSAGGVPASRVARWDGAHWEALGTGLNDEARALQVHDDGSGAALFVGGDFTIAGGRVSNHIAKWGAVGCSVSSYCTAGTTSSGCVPSIGAFGLPSASASSGFTIRIDDVEGQKQGHIFYGVNGALANPWSPLSSSYLCVKAPTQRTPTQNSGGVLGTCDGAIQIDWLAYVATHPGSLGAPFSAGTQVWAQLYFRDPPAPKTTNLSNGLTFVVAP